MKKKLWYVYVLSHPDKVSDSGRPLPGKTAFFKNRLSKYKKRFAESGVEPIMTPVAIFETEEEAFEYEQDLREQHGWKREVPLDQQRKWRKNGSEAMKTDEARIKQSEAAIEVQNRIDVKEKRRISLIENGKMLGNQNGIGYKHTDEAKQKIRYQSTCPHCNKTGHGNAMVRWHFDNCKYKK